MYRKNSVDLKDLSVMVYLNNQSSQLFSLILNIEIASLLMLLEWIRSILFFRLFKFFF